MFNGKSIKGPSELRNTVSATNPNEEVEVKIFREGEYLTKKMKLAVLEAEEKAADKESLENENDLGVQVSNLSSELRYRYKIDKKIHGVVITMIERGSLASFKGLKIGDVVQKLDGIEVKDSESFYQILEKSDFKKGIRLRLKRKGSNLFLFIKE